LISSVKATVGEHSTICANIQIIRNSANYTFWLSIFSFLLDKFDTGFELGVTTPLRTTYRKWTLAARKLWKQPGQIPHILSGSYLFTSQGVEQLSSQVAH